MKLKNKIPKGWIEARLKDIGTFDKGVGISKEQTSNVGYPCVRYGEIYTKYNFKIKNFSSFIPKEVSMISKQISKGDILFAGSGETAEEIAKCVACLHEGIAYASGDIIIFRLNDKKQNSLFYSYFFNTIGRKQINRLAEGNSIVHIYPEELSNINIILPPIKEQEKIVDILELWDKAIETTKKLIEQKKLQKKYLMQKLLTGKIRLKGFKDKWNNNQLKTLCSIKKGEQLNSNQLSEQNLYPCLNGGILPSGYTNKWNTEKNTITISEGGNSCGYVNFMKNRFWAGGHCYTLINVGINLEFLYLVLKFKEKQIMLLRVGSGLPNIQKTDLEKMCIKVPTDIAEQKAIADILSTADKQIDLLKQKLSKLQLQKKGLMQKLLIGQIRV